MKVPTGAALSPLLPLLVRRHPRAVAGYSLIQIAPRSSNAADPALFVHHLQAFVSLALQFLLHLVQEYPVELGQVTPLAVVPALGQMLSYPSGNIQASVARFCCASNAICNVGCLQTSDSWQLTVTHCYPSSGEHSIRYPHVTSICMDSFLIRCLRS